MHFEVHVNYKEAMRLSESRVIREKIEEALSRVFGIEHVTFKIEYQGCPRDGLIKLK